MRNAQTSLRIETPPLRVGDASFADGNAAARTFGRAHRRRPYHFSCSSMSQGCWRIVRRRTKTKKGCWRTVCRRTKTRKGCRRTVRRRTKTKKGCWRIVRRWTKSKKVAGEQFDDGLNREKVAGEQFAADIPHCLSQERCSPPIFRTIYRRKGARRRYSALFIAGKQFAADIPHRLSQENSSPLHNHKGIVVARCSPLH